MNVRRLAIVAGLALALTTAGCATSIAGQAEPAPGASIPTSAPALVPAATSNDPDKGPDAGTTAAPTADGDTSVGETTNPASTPPGSPTSELPSVPGLQSSIPGLTADCDKVLAGITAFTSVLQSGPSGADATISQADVDAALAQLPPTGLPAQPQADMIILRGAVVDAAGKTISELTMALTDGKVVGALEDLSTWVSKNCT